MTPDKATTHSKTQSSSATDAISLLTKDHATVLDKFKQYEKLGDGADTTKQKLAQQICEDLTIHMQIEEEIFYPAVRDALDDEDMIDEAEVEDDHALDDEDMIDEAEVEHDAAKDLIAQIEEMTPDESHYDAKVKVLGEEVEHHVEEEQDEMFAKIKKTSVDLKALGAEMAARKLELQAEFAGE